MDGDKNLVFNAARDGNLKGLKFFLKDHTSETIKILISMKTNGATPLIIASRNGHLKVVEYLIKECKSDIEQVGCVTFDGETIEGAPPLWCAAAAGHLNIVHTLVSYGANVNSTTKTNSTPLRAACFDGHYDIVKYLVEHGADIEIANRHGHTCLMIACYKGHFKISKYLIDCRASVNRKSVKGNTALHDCAESGSLEIMQLLLMHGAKMDADSYGMTPLLAAALTGHTPVVELIISLPICNRKERIDALELLGSTYVDKRRDMLGALSLWKRAMKERYASMPPIKKPQMPIPVSAYDNATEVRTIEQLDELVSDPDQMRIQALLVRERILGPSHPDTSYYIRYRGAVYADMGNFDRCIRLWMYALDMQQKVLEPMNTMTQSSLLSFAELFSYMMSKSVTTVKFADLFAIFQRCISELESMNRLVMSCPNAVEYDSSNFHRTLVIVLHFIGLLCRLKPYLNKSQEFDLKRAVYHLVQLNPRGKNGTCLLHLACHRDSDSLVRFPLCDLPVLEVVELLLEVGAEANAVDYEGNTPLHIAASAKPCFKLVFKSLLNHGAHLDTKNCFGKVPLQLAAHSSVAFPDIYPLRHLSLQCLCAQKIIDNGIPFKESLSDSLQKFVALHSFCANQNI